MYKSVTSVLDALALNPDLLTDPLSVGGCIIGASPPSLNGKRICFTFTKFGVGKTPGSTVQVKHVLQHGRDPIGRMHRVSESGCILDLEKLWVFLHVGDILLGNDLLHSVPNICWRISLPLSKHSPKEPIKNPPKVQQAEASKTTSPVLVRPINGWITNDGSHRTHERRRHHSPWGKRAHRGQVRCPRGVCEEANHAQPQIIQQLLDIPDPVAIGPPGLRIGSTVSRSVDSDEPHGELFEVVWEGRWDVTPTEAGTGEEEDWFAVF
mmetsp:Transcript_14787/g.28204  ORF Transcript_14787/g.28204 Transcript_14787/m.28204 type:complete len:266 (+) Transcript_14787:204-1001(+)